MFNTFINKIIINHISINILFFFNSKKKISNIEKNKFNDLFHDDELPKKNLTFSNIEPKNIRINDSIYYFGDGQESNNRKKNVTVDDILPLYIYENKLRLEEIYFYSDISENNKKIPNKTAVNSVSSQNKKNFLNDYETKKDKSKIIIKIYFLYFNF